MAYCRMVEDSDIYAYQTAGGYQVHTSTGRHYFTESISEFYILLKELQDNDLKVPDRAFQRVAREMQQETLKKELLKPVSKGEVDALRLD